MENTTTVQLPFDKNWNSVAISVSGGVDSALLTYMVCDKILNSKKFTIHIINNVRCWKTKPWQQNNFELVFNWFVSKFPDIYFKKHTNFVPPELEWGDKGRTIIDEYGKIVSGDTLELRSFAEYVCFKENVDAYFNGVTRNPANVNFKGMPTRDIDPTDENKHLELMIHMDKIVSHPFRFVDKSWILKKYKELNLGDLLSLTRSCEGEFQDLNYQNYKAGQYVPLCNNCFWCKEREWAIEQSK